MVMVEMARIAEDCGLQAVALHPRTREQGYSGQADWSRIAAIKAAVKIPVIGNGDILTPEDAVRMVEGNRLRRGHDWAYRYIRARGFSVSWNNIWPRDAMTNPHPAGPLRNHPGPTMRCCSPDPKTIRSER